MTIVEKIREAIKGTEFENNAFIAGRWVRDKVMNSVSKDN